MVSAVATPRPEANPIGQPWARVRRTTSSEIGPTVLAMVKPRTIPRMRSAESIRCRADQPVVSPQVSFQSKSALPFSCARYQCGKSRAVPTTVLPFGASQRRSFLAS